MLTTLKETYYELLQAKDAIRSAHSKIIDGADSVILRATVAGLLLGLETQLIAVNAAIVELSKNHKLLAPPAPEEMHAS